MGSEMRAMTARAGGGMGARYAAYSQHCSDVARFAEVKHDGAISAEIAARRRLDMLNTIDAEGFDYMDRKLPLLAGY